MLDKFVADEKGVALSIRTAKKENIPLIAKIINQVSQEEFLIGCEPDLGKEKETIAMLSNTLDVENLWIIAFKGEVPVGTAGSVRVPSFFPGTKIATLGLCVLKEFRHQGIGSALLDRIITWCKEASFSKIALNVFDHNDDARQMYKKFGFKAVDRRQTTLCIDGRYVNEIYMEKKL